MQNIFLEIEIPSGVRGVEVRAHKALSTGWLEDKMHLLPAETLLAVDSGAELDALVITNPKVIACTQHMKAPLFFQKRLPAF